MRGLTLSELSFGPPSLPSCSKSPRSVSCCLISLNSPYRKLSSNFSLHDPVPIFFRSSSQCWASSRKEVVSNCFDDQELWHLDDSSSAVSTKTAFVMEKSPATYNSKRGFHEIKNNLMSDDTVRSFLKFVLLSGSLMLQDSQPALAGSDIALGLQSIPLLGDLGDISTGILAYIFLRTRGQDLFHCSTSSS